MCEKFTVVSQFVLVVIAYLPQKNWTCTTKCLQFCSFYLPMLAHTCSYLPILANTCQYLPKFFFGLARKSGCSFVVFDCYLITCPRILDACAEFTVVLQFVLVVIAYLPKKNWTCKKKGCSMQFLLATCLLAPEILDACAEFTVVCSFHLSYLLTCPKKIWTCAKNYLQFCSF